MIVSDSNMNRVNVVQSLDNNHRLIVWLYNLPMLSTNLREQLIHSIMIFFQAEFSVYFCLDKDAERYLITLHNGGRPIRRNQFVTNREERKREQERRAILMKLSVFLERVVEYIGDCSELTQSKFYTLWQSKF